jgi:pimeloyl-ACP methyl ester carboxylesterase
MSLLARLLAAGLTGALLAGTAVAPATAVVPAAAAASDVTSPQEAERVDRVPAPELQWYACYGAAQCATVRLPLDYDEPDGATVELALLRLKARKQAQRIGTLFVNPGGPGGSGTDMAAMAPAFLSASVLDRFDVVGFDPRGIGASDNVKCFGSTREQVAAQKQLNMFFPYGAKQEAAYTKAARAVGRACSSTGAALAGAMSTAEVARDLDVLRRAVGDQKLTYLGFSYGTLLGQYYAAMFPDRVRALALDGVINPKSWTGSTANQGTLQDDRLRSADAAYRALRELLIRCDRAGTKRCVFAAGDPQKRFAAIARALRAKPLELGHNVRLAYADFIGLTLSALYSPDAGGFITAVAADVETLLAGGKGTKQRTTLRAHLSRLHTPARDYPYDNSVDAFSGVICTDGNHPQDTAQWPALTAAEDKRAPYFGRAWGWGDAQCARKTWTVEDEDAYRGPFNRQTAAPVLFVGNYWDPATSYRQAVSATALLPGSRLLSSDNWGHTAYGTSKCATTAVDSYLLRGTLPAAGTVCRSPMQPFTGRAVAATATVLPPVAGPYTALRQAG